MAAPGSVTKLWPRLALVGAALAAVALVVVMGGLLRGGGDDAAASATAGASVAQPQTETPSLLPSSSSAPTASPPAPIGTDLLWTETGSFGGGDAFEFATAVVRGSHGFVAVGTHYDQQLDPSGPLPPHEGRIWLSPDGRSWTEVDLPDGFANAVLNHVVTTTDGSLIAFGRITNDQGTEDREPLAAWESADGLLWDRVETNLPSDFTVQRIAGGTLGYVAALGNYTGGVPQLWFSADGRRWEKTYTAAEDEALADIGAGDQGFVAVGERGTGDRANISTFVIASSDGRAWIEASTPPIDAFQVAPMGEDWIAIGPGPYSDYGADIETPVWFSANGLDWREIGNLLLHVVQPEGDLTCREFVSDLNSAGEWLVVGTAYSYPCSEGGVVGYGSQRISVDGTTWGSLPFGGFSYEQNPRVREDGSIILAATVADGGLVLVGQSNGRATFWFGAPR